MLPILVACGISEGFRKSHLYRVRSGDTLYAISWRYQLDYKTLARWNNISPPYLIHPGQELILSDPDELPPERRPASGGLSKSPDEPVKSSKASRKADPPPKDFIWPTKGKVVQKFAGRKSGSQGIDIAGEYGQEVRAAAAGRVVYSGNGLSGYGKLVIVKHNEDFLSAYAHNSKLYVKEGEQVKTGQLIAAMGDAGDNQARLHFEVRKQGRPVDPLKYLPGR